MTIKKNIFFCFLLILINIGLAILPHLAVKPFWDMRLGYVRNTTLFEFLYTAFLLPILLLKLNKFLNNRFGFNYYAFTVLLMIVSIFLSLNFHFKNFADMTGKGGDPDIGTKWFMIIDLILGLITISIGVGIKYYKERKNRNSNDNLKGVEEK